MRVALVRVLGLLIAGIDDDAPGSRPTSLHFFREKRTPLTGRPTTTIDALLPLAVGAFYRTQKKKTSAENMKTGILYVWYCIVERRDRGGGEGGGILLTTHARALSPSCMFSRFAEN